MSDHPLQELQAEAHKYVLAGKSDAWIREELASKGISDPMVDVVMAKVQQTRKAAAQKTGKRTALLGAALIAIGLVLVWLLAGWQGAAFAYVLPLAGTFTLLKGLGTMVRY